MSNNVWFLAECQDCTPIIPQPFKDANERTRWAGIHAESSGHRVLLDQTNVEARQRPPTESEIRAIDTGDTKFFRCPKCTTLKMVNIMFGPIEETERCHINGCEQPITELSLEQFLIFAKEKERSYDQEIFPGARFGRF